MKKLFIVSLLFLTTISIYAQDFQEMRTIELKTASDFEENESNALKCAEYLLNNAIDSEDNNRLFATQFMMKWMEGTDITFNLGDDFLKYSGGNNDRTQVYLASLVYVALQDGEKNLEPDDINTKAADVFLKYCLKFKSLKRNKAIKQELKNYPKN